MTSREVVLCRTCGQVYAARKRDDGTFLLPTVDGRCKCGNGAFRAFAGM